MRCHRRVIVGDAQNARNVVRRRVASQDVHGLAVGGDDDVPFEPSGARHTGQDLEPEVLA
jgi:hypothetical protein